MPTARSLRDEYEAVLRVLRAQIIRSDAQTTAIVNGPAGSGLRGLCARRRRVASQRGHLRPSAADSNGCGARVAGRGGWNSTVPA